MKKSDLHLWKTFKNNTGHLSIVYLITKTNIYLINYNGSLYSINNNSHNTIKYDETDITSDQFFNQFPINRLDYKSKPEYLKIQSKYFDNFREKKTNNKLLLIL